MTADIFDLAIIGGGINGAGIARDAAGRGLKVLLVEQNDLASGTSSQSSKLIHGGLRYLEYGELRLVREALAERETLMRIAPHIVTPLRFVLPHSASLRPRALIRAGLFLYDRLARRALLDRSQAIDLARDPAGRPLMPHLKHGFTYSDCWADDARLVVLNAVDARERGADIRTRTRLLSARPEGGHWLLDLGAGGAARARVLVNAAGPWAGIAGLGLPGPSAKLRLVKGSHIVVPRIAGAEDAYLFQNEDRRVVFLLPFEREFSLIGTTDVPFEGDPAGAAISDEEERYLVAAVNRYLEVPVARRDIVWRFAGVRPLADDGHQRAQGVSRDYRLDLSQADGGQTLLTVIGGKLTTYRKLAEAVLAKLASALGTMGPAWTATTPLPGGDVGEVGIEGVRLRLARAYPGIDRRVLDRLLGLYGTRAFNVLGNAQTDADLGAGLGGGLTEREVAYLGAHEFARSSEDVLFRRTKVGLHLSPEALAAARQRIDALLASNQPKA